MKRLTQGNIPILIVIMPNPNGYTDSIKDSQFKAAWQSGATRTIRVPIALADATLEYARQLDKDSQPHDTADSGVNTERGENITQSHDTSGSSDEMSRLRDENEQLQVELQNSEVKGEELAQELARVRSLLEMVQANPPLTPTPEIELPEAADLLNRLKAKRKKATASLADVEALLDIIGGF